MSLLFNTRLSLFALLSRENEQAFYLMQLARIERKRTADYDVLKTNDYFKKCFDFRHKIIDFEYEYAKFLKRKKNAHEAATWLHE